MKKEENAGKNMTAGTPWKLILSFALPLMLGNIFQQLYTVTDTAIVGRAIGVDALAALGTVDFFTWMSIGIVQGITQGFSIRISQKFGEEDHKGVKKTAGQSMALCILLTILFLILLQLSIQPVFLILRIPEQIRPMAECYLRIIFAGIPATMAYNLFSAMLRALGDSKTPLVAMVFASAGNIILDIVFVVGLKTGVGGAAAATVLAQLFAGVFCFLKMLRIPMLRAGKKDYVLTKDEASILFQLALPMAFQNIVISVGGMIVQSVVNRYGVAFIAGYTATNKLYGLLEIAAISYGYAMVTYAGQNLGAGNYKRIKEGFWAGIWISMVTSAMITSIMFLGGRQILSLFLDPSSGDAAEAMRIAFRYLKIMSIFLPVLYVLHIVRSTLQGMGNTVVPMLSGVGEFCMRTFAAIVYPLLFQANGILFAEVSAWMGADVVLVSGYIREMKRNRHKL